MAALRDAPQTAARSCPFVRGGRLDHGEYATPDHWGEVFPGGDNPAQVGPSAGGRGSQCAGFCAASGAICGFPRENAGVVDSPRGYSSHLVAPCRTRSLSACPAKRLPVQEPCGSTRVLSQTVAP